MASSGKKPRRESPIWVTQDGLDTVLRALRERLGVTQKEVADRAGVSPAMIARLESGDRRPSREILTRLAAVFGTTLDGLTHAAQAVASGEAEEAALDAMPPADAPAGDDPLLRQPAEPFAPDGASTLDPAAASLLRDVARWINDADPPHELKHLRKELEDLLTTPSRGSETVAAIPSGEIRYVFAHALSRDERGQLWIDPRARVRIGGYDSEDPRVERYDDGRIVIDTSRLGDDVEFAPRDRVRHLVRVVEESGVTSSDDVDADVYASSVIEMTWTDGTKIVIEPQPEGITDGDLPDGVDSIHIITAFNPRSRLLSASENEERNRLLQRDLDAAGLTYVEAIGRSPDRSWSEDSYAIIDRDREALLDLARRYEQAAIFEWTAGHRAVLWTDPSQDPEVHGWKATTPRN